MSSDVAARANVKYGLIPKSFDLSPFFVPIYISIILVLSKANRLFVKKIT